MGAAKTARAVFITGLTFILSACPYFADLDRDMYPDIRDMRMSEYPDYHEESYYGDHFFQDNCVDIFNPDQDDTDRDDVGDACDNCKEEPNFDQSDLDGDTLGDVCDTDTDGDGYTNEDELSIYGTSTTNPDSDGDGWCDGGSTPDQDICKVHASGYDPDPLGTGYRLLLKALQNGADVTSTWLPEAGSSLTEAGNSVEILARMMDPSMNSVAFQGTVNFNIECYPNEGRALNEEEDPPYTNDASFDANDPSITSKAVIVKSTTTRSVTVTLYSFDFGTEATVKVQANLPNGSPVFNFIELPLDTDDDGIPNAIENRYRSCGFNPYKSNSLDVLLNDGDTDLDIIKSYAKSGDDILNRRGDGILSKNEWRGVTLYDVSHDEPILYNPDGSGPIHTIQYVPNFSGVAFTRLDPCRPSLFVRGDGFANSLPPATVPDAIAFTLSVDDVIAPRPPGETPPRSIMNALEEIGLQVFDVTGLKSFGEVDEPPYLDILVVTYDADTRDTPATSDIEDGYINHEPILYIPYLWSWDSNGWSCYGTEEYYGSTDLGDGCGTFVLHLNMMYYFFNRPYLNEITSSPDNLYSDPPRLDPKELIEDNILENGVLDIWWGEDRYNPGIFDGDHMLPNWWRENWGTKIYELGRDLSVFDQDRDGLIENPIVSDSLNSLHSTRQDPGEYTLQQKGTHTILHEIYHSLGVEGHSVSQYTEDMYCLMDTISRDWSRAGHVSNWAREQVLVHNGIEYSISGKH